MSNKNNTTAYQKECSHLLLSDVGQKYHLKSYCDFYEKSNYFSQIFVNNIDDFEKKLIVLRDRDDLLFRGINEAKYKLYNSMQRFLFDNYSIMDLSYKELLKKLQSSFIKTENGILTHLLKRQNGNSELNALTCFSFLQHYGCPTPFLDWTYNLNSALFFATDGATYTNNSQDADAISNYISIYVAHKQLLDEFAFQKPIIKFLNDSNMPSQVDTILDVLVDNIFEINIDENTVLEAKQILIKRRRKRFIESCINNILSIDILTDSKLMFISDKQTNEYFDLPVSNNLNILNQEGAFIFISHPFLPLESIVEKYYTLVSQKNQPEMFYSINIHKSLIPKINDYLIENNYNKNKIYPDPYKISSQVFDNVITELKKTKNN